MTLSEARYETRVEVQQPPLVNLFTNPNAQVSLGNATSTGIASFVRQTGLVGVSPGGTAFRLNGNAAVADSFMNIEGDFGGVLRNGMKPGVQYTVSGNFYASAALTGTADGRARRIAVFHRIGAGAVTQLLSAQAPNAAGNTRVDLTFTLPAGTTEAVIRFYHGHAGTSSAFWHSLLLNEGTNTTYFDGTPSGGLSFTSAETGWDGTIGLSTSRRVLRSENVTIPDADIELDYDIHRVPYIQARVTAPIPALATLGMLRPTRSRDVILNWSVAHYKRATSTADLVTVASSAPISYGPTQPGKLWVRDLEVDWVNRTITLTASSGEVRLEDKKRIADVALNTGATTAAELFLYALADAGEYSAFDGFSGSAISIPAGDRRLWVSGGSANSLFEKEYAAVEERMYCSDVGLFGIYPIEEAPGSAGSDTLLQDGVDGTIISASESWARDQWRDATLVKADYIVGAGTRVTAYQRDQDGVNQKGEVTQIARPIPGATYAASVTARAKRRAWRFKVTAQLDFNHRPGRRIDLNIQAASLAATILPERIVYRPAEGVMEIEGVAP